MNNEVDDMNFLPLLESYPALAHLGQKAEDLIRDRHYRESVQTMRQFAEGALITVLNQKASLGEMMHHPLFFQLADSKTRESFRRIRALGNYASHFVVHEEANLSPYVVRTESDAIQCLKYGHWIAVWLMSLKNSQYSYPDFNVQGLISETMDENKHQIIFDSYQQAVIEISSGKHLVLAPPGCGKTEILTERIRFALEHGVDAKDILCLTFTNRAARGMQERIEERFSSSDVRKLYVGNIHRFCYKFLLDEGVLPESVTILDEEEVRDLIEGLLIDCLPQNKKSGNRHSLPLTVSNYIQTYASNIFRRDHNFPLETIDNSSNFEVYRKNKELLDSYGLLDFDKLSEEKLVEVGYLYMQYKQSRQLVDFNDLLLKTWLFLNNEVCPSKRYSWIQIDEVQDLSPLQLDIVRLLWDKKNKASVCVYFGDEQQAIFSFMGAKLETLQNLHNSLTLHRLYRNFRSPSYLLNLFNEYAVKNLECESDILPRADKKCERPKEALKIIRVGSPWYQKLTVGKLVQKNQKDQTTVVIVPSNKEADNISSYFRNLNIEHFKISGSDVFNQEIFKAGRAYLGILLDDSKCSNWAQLIYRLSEKKNASLKQIRDYLEVKFSALGLLASDLLLYSSEGTEAPASLVEDFTRAYRNEVIFLDLETTGLEAGSDKVESISAAKMKNGKVVDRLFLTFKSIDSTQRDLVLDNGFKEFLDFVGCTPVICCDLKNEADSINAKFAVLEEQLSKLQKEEHKFSFGGQSNIEVLKRFDIFKLFQALHFVILPKEKQQKRSFHNVMEIINSLGLEIEGDQGTDKRILPTPPQSAVSSQLNSRKLTLSNLREVLNTFGGTERRRGDLDKKLKIVTNLLDSILIVAQPLVQQQRTFLETRAIRLMAHGLQDAILPIYKEHKKLLVTRMDQEDEAILVQVLRQFIERLSKDLKSENEEEIIKKIPLVYEYLRQVLIDKKKFSTLKAQLKQYLVAINVLKEPDLCTSNVVKDNIFISTVHKAKGLEFDNVIVTNVTEGIYPFFLSIGDKKKEQEDARKLYVAMTRAKRTLCLICPRYNQYNNSIKPIKPSPFLESILDRFECIEPENS